MHKCASSKCDPRYYSFWSVCVDVFLVRKYAVGVCDLWILSFWEKAGNELPQLERLI